MARIGKVRIASVVVSVLILCLTSTANLMGEDPPNSDSPRIVLANDAPPREPAPEFEDISVPCEAGSHTFEVGPATTKVRVLIENFMQCLCFASAESAAAWMQGYRDERIREKDFGSFNPAGSDDPTGEIRPISPGDQIEVTMFCYTVDQILDYGEALVSDPSETSGS